MISKTCLTCSSIFCVPAYRYNTAKFCSYKCMGQSSRKTFEKECEICSSVFTFIATRIDKAKYCSRICYYKSMSKKGSVKQICKNCNSEFLKSPCKKNKKFCSKECLTNHTKNTYKDSFSSVRAFLKRSGRLSKCQICGFDSVPEIMGVHHIDRNRKNNNIENLMVLCPNCHSIEHRKHIPHSALPS